MLYLIFFKFKTSEKVIGLVGLKRLLVLLYIKRGKRNLWGMSETKRAGTLKHEMGNRMYKGHGAKRLINELIYKQNH